MVKKGFWYYFVTGLKLWVSDLLKMLIMFIPYGFVYLLAIFTNNNLFYILLIPLFFINIAVRGYLTDMLKRWIFK